MIDLPGASAIKGKSCHPFHRFSVALLCLQIISAILFVAFSGICFQSPERDPEPSDLIVVLGGGSMSARLSKGVDLYAQGFATRILVTGFSEDSLAIVSMQEDWRYRYLQGLGIPATSILTNATARNTWQEAQTISELMRTNRWSKVLIVSDPPHFLRLSWIFSQALQPSEISYRLISSKPEWWNEWLWWKNPTSATFVIEELIKVLYYVGKYPWHA